MASNKRVYPLATLVSLATFALYLPALRNGFVRWDDPRFVVDNPHIRSLDWTFFRWAFTDTATSYWHPLAWISHALDYALWGLNPAGHHLTSIALHAANAFLVVALAARLVQVWRAQAGVQGASGFPDERAVLVLAGVTGLVFGIHPIHVESAAWITERKHLLCTFFFLLSIAAYTRHAAAERRDGASPEWGWLPLRGAYFLSLGFCFLALAGKAMAVSLPVVLVILDWFPLFRIRSLKSLVAACVEKIPFALLSAAVAAAAIFSEQAAGAVASLTESPLSGRLLMAAKALVWYLGKMALPLDLSPYYPLPQGISLASPGYLFPSLLVLGVTLACVLAARKQRLWLAVWGYYVCTIFPVLNVLQTGNQNLTDRSTYLPGLGPHLLVGLAAAWVWTRAAVPGARSLPARGAVAGAGFCLAAGLAFLTVRHIAVWKDSVTLWSHVIARNPGQVPLAYVNRGAAYLKAGNLDLALADLNQAVGLDRDRDAAHFNRGLVYLELGQSDRALADFSAAIALSPGMHDAHLNRAAILADTGRLEEALRDYTDAINLSPLPDKEFTARGIVFEKLGRLDLAVRDFTAALTLNPANEFAFRCRGWALGVLGRREESLADYQRACALGSADGCEALRALREEGR